MAVPTNTVTAHSAIGNREDLADIIWEISPVDVPVSSRAPKVGASAVYHEWQTEALDAAAANRAIEGDDATANTFVPTTRVGNYLQISQKTISVSGTQRAVNTAGRADEYSHQVARRGREIIRDIEYAITQNQASSAGGAATARSSAGLESWLSTNRTTLGASITGATTPGFAAGVVAAPTDATATGAFTKAGLDAVIQACWTEGGDPKLISVGAGNKTVASGFTGIATLYKNVPQGQATIIGGADLYVSNFGEHMIVANRFQRNQTALVLDMEYIAIATLRNMETETLAKTGDSDKSQLICEFTLEVRNEAASGKVTDLS